MRYQVEVDGEVVAVFSKVTWAKTFGDEFAVGKIGDGFMYGILVVDGYTDTVVSEWTREFV
jgi:hypothetical protein